jgi:hypothetical protein
MNKTKILLLVALFGLGFGLYYYMFVYIPENTPPPTPAATNTGDPSTLQTILGTSGIGGIINGGKALFS